MRRLLQITVFVCLFCNLLTTTPSGTCSSEVLNTDDTNGTLRLTNTINDFGYKLLGEILTHDKYENIIISPTGIAGLLAMTLVGTVGNTYEEIADALGFSHDMYDNRENHDQFGTILQQLNSECHSSKTLYANALFVDQNIKLRDLYREYVSRVYRSDAYNIEFKESVEAKNRINEWVKNNTEGEIENFLKSTLPQDTKIVLLNALYFSGQWQHVFFPEFTMKMPFTRIKNGDVLADFMLNVGEFRYIYSENYGAQMIALPYNDSITTMYVLKPINPKESGLSKLLASLDQTKLDELISQMSTHKCVIRLPKMELQSANKLEGYIKNIGVRSIFNPVQANFALMVDGNVNNSQIEIVSRIAEEIDIQRVRETLNSLPNPGIYVDTVLQDVRLTVNEYGTEAVAATAGVLARTAAQFYANSPFYLFIRNERTKLITFSAAIFDPTT